MNRHGELVDRRRHGPRARAPPPRVRRHPQGAPRATRSKAGQLLAEWDAFATPILTEVGGIVKFGDIVEGVTMIEKLDEVTGLSRKVVIESRAADLRPRISLKDPETGETLKLPNSDARRALPPPGRREHRRAGRRPHRGRRGHRQDPARHDEDAGHHRRSAARRRALRGPQAQGPRHHRGDRRRGVASARTPRASARWSSRRSARRCSR